MEQSKPSVVDKPASIRIKPKSILAGSARFDPVLNPIPLK